MNKAHGDRSRSSSTCSSRIPHSVDDSRRALDLPSSSTNHDEINKVVGTTPESSTEYERVFVYFDENNDGKISALELQKCLRSVNQDLTIEEATDVIRNTDSDGDGLLGYDDFLRLVVCEKEDEMVESLREAFRMYEAEDGCGITPKSLKKMLLRLGEKATMEKCVDMIRMFDLNGDGVINFEEFKVMML